MRREHHTIDVSPRPAAVPPADRHALSGGAGAWVGVALLTVLGAYFRLANLGVLGFRWDEDLTALAVRAIMEQGVPELPSGMVYLRGSWLLWLMAWSAELLGFSEFSLRLPAAVFGIAMIPLAFVFGRALFDTRVGLLAAGLLAISAWDIEMSRYARMYAPFAFFYVLTALLVWRYRVQRESPLGGAAALACAFVSISLHQLGYTLALLFLVTPLLPGRPLFAEPRKLLFPLVAAAAVGAFFLLWNALLGHYRTLARAAAAGAGSADGGLSILERAGSTLVGALASILPPMPLVAALLERAPAVLAVLAAAACAAIALFLLRRREGAVRTPLLPPAGMADTALLGAVAASVVLQLINVALIAVVLLAFRKRRGLAALRSPDVCVALGLLAAGTVAWVVAAVALDLTGPAQGTLMEVKSAVRAVLNYPRFYLFWGFVREWPLAALPAAVGVLWTFHYAARRLPHTAALFLILALATPLVVNGLFETRYELFRYAVPLYTFYFCFVALGILRWTDVWAAVTPNGRGTRAGMAPVHLAAGTAVAAALVLAIDFNPAHGFMITERAYSSERRRQLGLETYYRDFKTPAAFVAAAAAAEDVVIVFDTREYYNYLGRLDYWVATALYEDQTYDDGGIRRDLYVGTPLLSSLTALQEVLDGPGTKWIIASDTMLAESPMVSDDVRRFLADRRDRVVYVGGDGATRVYRFEPADPEPITVTDLTPDVDG